MSAQTKPIEQSKRRLYWVWTADHKRDWFVVATRPQEAERTHCGKHTYDPGDAHARLIAELPDNRQGHGIGRPSVGVIEGCGGVYIKVENNKETFRIGSEMFTEGRAVRRIEQEA